MISLTPPLNSPAAAARIDTAIRAVGAALDRLRFVHEVAMQQGCLGVVEHTPAGDSNAPPSITISVRRLLLPLPPGAQPSL
jgi:hypothetical protein